MPRIGRCCFPNKLQIDQRGRGPSSEVTPLPHRPSVRWRKTRGIIVGAHAEICTLAANQFLIVEFRGGYQKLYYEAIPPQVLRC